MRPTFWRRSYAAKLQESLEVETLRPLPKKREDAPGGPGGLPRGAYRKGHTERLCGLGSTPAPHRKRLRTTNVLERLNQEIKRRTNVARIFPGEEACLRLVTALAVETSEEWVPGQGLPGYGASRGDGGSERDRRKPEGGDDPARYR